MRTKTFREAVSPSVTGSVGWGDECADMSGPVYNLINTKWEMTGKE